MKTLPTGVKTKEVKQWFTNVLTIEVESDIVTPNRLKEPTCSEQLHEMFKGFNDAYNGNLMNN